MSTAESHEFSNDLNETDFPYLSSKPLGKRADKGRRSGAERVAARTLADQATVVKTIHDPQNVLGKRRKARLASTCSDNIALDVPYSLNRKNRWEEIDVDSLAKNSETSALQVAIIEKTYKANEFLNHNSAEKAQAVHLVGSDGSIKSKTARGKGVDPTSLVHELKKDSGSEAESEDEVRLEYRIVRPHTNLKVLFQSSKAGKLGKQRNKNRRNKKVDLDELETSEMENSYHRESDSDVYKPSRDFRFCLGDYINTPNTDSGMVEVRRASIESVLPLDREDVIIPGPTPIELLDISSAVRAPGAFETVIIKPLKWPAFNFTHQVESLATDKNLVVRWIDANHQRATIDLTKRIVHDEDSKPQLFVILEKGRKGHFQLLLNSAIPSYGPFSWRTLKDIFKNKSVNNLKSAIDVIANLVSSWRTRMPPSPDHCQPGSRYFTAGENFDSLVNSRSMAKPAAIISDKEMYEILREASTEVGVDSFEKIEDEDIICENSQLEDTNSTVTDFHVKCHSCKQNAPEELFELDDYWQCRECLRQHIVNLIRTKNIPVEVPFVVPENSSTFDVLPSLIPLPLINFYTKLTALEMIQCSDSEIGDLMNCPACQKDVRVERPNEYRSCLCTNCYIAWCPDCNSEPHWPMHCEQFSDWTTKWQQQFAVESMGDEFSKYIRRIHCSCGGIIECGDLAERAECHNCGISFNPTTLKVETKRYYWPYPSRYRKYHKQYLEHTHMFLVDGYGRSIQETLDVKEIALLPVLRVIKKDFAEPCARARTMRFNRQKGSEVEKKCRKMKESDPGVAVFPDVRRTILCLVEYGLAWVYMSKGANFLKTGLIQLFKQCEELTDDITEGKVNLGSRVSTLDDALNKMIDQIKKTL